MKIFSFMSLALSILLTACGEKSSEKPTEIVDLVNNIELFDPAAFAPFENVRDDERFRNQDSRAALAAYGYDPFLEWNKILLDANAVDHSLAAPDQGGPTKTSRAFAIVHLSMYETANAVFPIGRPYLDTRSRQDVHVAAAVAAAAHKALWHLYPQQRETFNRALSDAMQRTAYDESIYRGVALGRYAAGILLDARRGDGSEEAGSYQASRSPGVHQPDPVNPKQGFLSPAWGQVRPFGISDKDSIRLSNPPPLRSEEYAEAFEEVRRLGGDGVTTPTDRSPEQTVIGIYWAYDGASGIGTPPRLYNQIVRVIAQQQGNSPADNAVLFAVVNTAMADAAIVSWDQKYRHAVWRPVVGIRAAHTDGNSETDRDSDWTPLGAPASNSLKNNFSPNFPAYSSGHATFGAAIFRALENFYGTDEICFDFVSDEYNGQTRDNRGVVRPRISRRFKTLSEANEENGQSRIYLGVHWQFDKTEGFRTGRQVADEVTSRFLLND